MRIVFLGRLKLNVRDCLIFAVRMLGCSVELGGRMMNGRWSAARLVLLEEG